MIVFHFMYILVVEKVNSDGFIKKKTKNNHTSYPLSLKSASSITLLVPPILLVARTANSRHNGTLYSRNLSAVGVTAGMATAGCWRILW